MVGRNCFSEFPSLPLPPTEKHEINREASEPIAAYAIVGVVVVRRIFFLVCHERDGRRTVEAGKG